MYAENLKLLLLSLSEKQDVSAAGYPELTERFVALRGSALLPRGRDKREQVITAREIVSAILGLASERPGFAALGSIVLARLQPVGGPAASFHESPTLAAALELILLNKTLRETMLLARVSIAEHGTNSNGFATLIYEAAGARRRVYFVPKHAVSLLQPGVEMTFDAERYNAPVSREMVFNRAFFDRVAHEVEEARLYPAPGPGDSDDYNAEEAAAARNQRLGARPGSRFLNLGIDNQVTWPKEETLITFDRYKFVLMPKTADHMPSVHVDLTGNRLDVRSARTVINRFLSIMVWCDDQFAILQSGWAGNPVPVAVPRRDLAFTTTHHWIFDRKIPTSVEAQRALALYREARNAEQNYMVSYAVLNFYKVIELGISGHAAIRKWFTETFEILRVAPRYSREFQAFATICGTEKPGDYIYKACRIAVAHANKDSKSDPDESSELQRLHTAADIMRIFARYFIANELKISTSRYSGD